MKKIIGQKFKFIMKCVWLVFVPIIVVVVFFYIDDYFYRPFYLMNAIVGGMFYIVLIDEMKEEYRHIWNHISDVGDDNLKEDKTEN